MLDPLSAAAITTLVFTTAVGKLAESLTEDAHKHLCQKLQTFKQLLSNKFKGRAKAALLKADQGSESDIEAVSNWLSVAMDGDADFAQQVQELAQTIQQVIDIGQVQGQSVQNVLGGTAYQVNNAEGPVIQGNGNTINVH